MRSLFALLIASFVWLWPSLLWSAEGSEYSQYEQATIDDALEYFAAEAEPKPSGKRIERIDIVRLDVLEERDPYPRFFNVFHVTTRDWVIRRELLFKKGQVYDQQRINETERNLRGRRQLSLVLIIALKGSKPDRVRLLVITKDVWSLRLNSNFQIADGEISTLLLQPAEENLLGTHTTLGALFTLDPATYSLGGLFINRRVAGSRIRAIASGNVIFNRESGEPEGSFGTLLYGQPLYSVRTRWGYQALFIWRHDVFRSFVGTSVRDFSDNSTGESIPYEYAQERDFGSYALTRSFGTANKHDFSLGYEMDRRWAKPRAPASASPALVARFIREAMPVNDTRIGPMLQYRGYSSEFLRTHDLETLSLQEDIRLGHDFTLRLYPAFKSMASTRNMLGTFAALSYTLPLGDGLARVIAASTVEFSTPEETDALIELRSRVASPRLGFGRLIHDTVFFNRYENYFNEFFALGGGGRLRGYPLQAFLGKDLVASNLEFRTSHFTLLSTAFGGALFYDLGDAFNGMDALNPKHSAGVGVRVTFPQATRSVFRADWGFPLSPGYPALPGSLFLTFRQAYGFPVASPPTPSSDLIE